MPLLAVWIPAALAASTSYRVIVSDRNNVLSAGASMTASNVDGASEQVTLRDDGQNPDAKASDGAWTATLTVAADDAVFLSLTTSTGTVRGSGAVTSERPDLRLILNNGQLVPERGNEVKGAATGPAPGATPPAATPGLTSAPAASDPSSPPPGAAEPTAPSAAVPAAPAAPMRVSSWSDFSAGFEFWGIFAAGFGAALGGGSAYLLWRRTDVPAGGLRGRWGMRMVDEWRRIPGRPSVLVGPGAADRVFRTAVSAGEVGAVAARLGPRTLIGVTDVDLLDRDRPDEPGLDALIRRVDGRFEIHVALEVPPEEDADSDGPAEPAPDPDQSSV